MSDTRPLALGAVILAGGTGARIGGADKASIELGGRTLLDWALDAVLDAGEVVVLGDWVPTERPVTFTREDPRGGGPAAGLLHGLESFARAPRQLMALAVDMPFVDLRTVTRLRDGARGRDGAVLCDLSGRRQLAMVLDTERLAAAAPPYDERHGMPLHRLLDGLDLVDVPGRPEEALDIDSFADLREARTRFEES
ncbi:molybdenum cofactor guanylyltransferase [Nocardioides daejeonensis]|uniref:molybdenum cofactor guanylyltransferase n=1 Tax=Nocardioides daejeonensis TaxID=1046556 RepID=UPI001EF4347A|nr:NTP transferase domain-containing protein [Nocardioides daejeonensis]